MKRGRKPLPKSQKRTPRCMTCAPSTWVVLDALAKADRVNIGRVLDVIVERFGKLPY